MRISLHRLILFFSDAVVLLAFTMIVSVHSYGSQQPHPFTGRFNDSILVQKKMISRSHKIGLYPDAMQKILFFTVKGEEGKVYQLYVFDMDGILIKQTEIRNRQTTFIKDMKRGNYLFDVFCDDDKIGNGQIAVR